MPLLEGNLKFISGRQYYFLYGNYFSLPFFATQPVGSQKIYGDGNIDVIAVINLKD
ncbi:hypothetical protein [Nostoc sp.]|uniref:hypothetical protein n=1 Tax=Nostoc sp. TaxID=1180 RepID=UPI00359339B2